MVTDSSHTVKLIVCEMLRFMKNMVVIPRISRPTNDAFLIPYFAIQKISKSLNTIYIGPFNGEGVVTITYDTEELATNDFHRIIDVMNRVETNTESPLHESERPVSKKVTPATEQLR